jgi:hypothetical protein
VLHALTVALTNPALLARVRVAAPNETLLPVDSFAAAREFCPDGRARDAMRDRVRDHDDGVRAGVLEAGEKTRTSARLLEEQARSVRHHTAAPRPRRGTVDSGAPSCCLHTHDSWKQLCVCTGSRAAQLHERRGKGSMPAAPPSR